MTDIRMRLDHVRAPAKDGGPVEYVYEQSTEKSGFGPLQALAALVLIVWLVAGVLGATG